MYALPSFPFPPLPLVLLSKLWGSHQLGLDDSILRLPKFCLVYLFQNVCFEQAEVWVAM
jgi:hypothetical protein